MDSDDVHKGFVQLRYPDDDDLNRGKVFTALDLRSFVIAGVCWTKTLVEKSETILNVLESFKTDVLSCSEYEGFALDWVDSIRCTEWPPEASEWKARERRHRWPSPEIVESVTGEGCCLVAKAHDSRAVNVCEWRISFSIAELTLIHSWSYDQKLVYHVLRLVKKDALRRCEGRSTEPSYLKTYHFKSLMLWACEEKPAEFWERRNLGSSLRELLCTMIEWLIEKDCRNYFISSNNIWDVLPEHHDFDREIQALLFSIDNLKQFIDSVAHLQRGNFDHNRDEINVSISNKCLIVARLRSYRAFLLDPTSCGLRRRHTPSKALEDTWQFTSAMKYLYRALAVHQLFVSQTLERKLENELLVDISEYFRRFRYSRFDGYTDVNISVFDNFHDIFRKIIHTPVGSKRRDRKCCPNSDILLLEDRLNLIAQGIDNDIKDPFYFVSCAYEANFHYTAFEGRPREARQDHWTIALDLCNTALEIAENTRKTANHWIANITELLPVVVTREFADIFDGYVKAALNTSSGLTDCFEAENFAVHFSLEDFLRYVRIQCMRNLNIRFDEEREIVRLQDTTDLNPTRMFLCDALRLSSR